MCENRKSERYGDEGKKPDKMIKEGCFGSKNELTQKVA